MAAVLRNYARNLRKTHDHLYSVNGYLFTTGCAVASRALRRRRRTGAVAVKKRDPYHMAVTALADSAGAGRFGWGRPLVVTALAAELGLSPTPVREALARLAGEGLFDHHPGRGYFAASPSASDIVNLYEMHRRLANWAIDLIPRGAKPAAIETSALRVEALFASLVSTAGNDVLNRAHRRTALQLRPVRHVEGEVAPVPEDQIVQQEQLLVGGDFSALRQALEIYHQDRMTAAQTVFSVMRRSSESIDRI